MSFPFARLEEHLLAIAFVCGSILVSALAVAEPTGELPGYTVTRVSDAVASANLSQLAFRPGDTEHLFGVQADGQVWRYDYDAGTATLSDAVVVASGLGQALGLAFHGEDLYVSLDLGGSLFDRPGDGRITRLSDPDANGLYRVRHDFVHSIPKGNHDVNHIQIVGDTLYVGIGAVGRRGDPAEENVYTMSIARIVDLNQVDFSGPIGPDFKGPVNHLADETDWLDLSAVDGKLRYFASGFRNPFGLAVDADGDLWVTSLGNSDAGFLSRDYLYKKVPPGAQGVFPPGSFGFGDPHIVGTPFAPLADLGQNPSPTGLDFMPSGPDAGKVVVAQAGASNQVEYPVGRDVLLVDPESGVFQILIDGLVLPTDVARDPLGRLLIADYGDDSIWLLTPPPAPVAGLVPDGHTVPGQALEVELTLAGEVRLSWGPSCGVDDDDYAIYRGTIGSYYDHDSAICSTRGALTATLPAAAESVYYLVVPVAAAHEGFPGRRSDGSPRPQGQPACFELSSQASCP